MCKLRKQKAFAGTFHQEILLKTRKGLWAGRED